MIVANMSKVSLCYCCDVIYSVRENLYEKVYLLLPIHDITISRNFTYYIIENHKTVILLVLIYPYQLLLVSQRNSTKVQPIRKEKQPEQLREG